MSETTQDASTQAARPPARRLRWVAIIGVMASGLFWIGVVIWNAMPVDLSILESSCRAVVNMPGEPDLVLDGGGRARLKGLLEGATPCRNPFKVLRLRWRYRWEKVDEPDETIGFHVARRRTLSAPLQLTVTSRDDQGCYTGLTYYFFLDGQTGYLEGPDGVQVLNMRLTPKQLWGKLKTQGP